MVETAGHDLKVALGLLDVRHVAGDPNLTLRLRTTMLTEWRRDARERLRALRALVDSRHELMGELAHASVPDLKETEGGIRDATVLKALVATWLVDVPHVELERSRLAMLDVRDQVQAWPAGRPTGSPRRCGRDLAPLLDVAGRPRRPGRGPRARPPDRAPVPADLAPRGRRPGPGHLRAPPVPDAGRRGRRAGRGRDRAGQARPVRPRTRRCCCAPPRRPPSATWCWRRRPRPGWPGSARRCRRRGPPRPATSWCGCSRPVGGLLGHLGDARGDRGARPASCPSGSGSGCCRTPRRSTASRSTGTSSRPASRRRP